LSIQGIGYGAGHDSSDETDTHDDNGFSVGPTFHLDQCVILLAFSRKAELFLAPFPPAARHFRPLRLSTPLSGNSRPHGLKRLI
jgi:hypothetical protein